MPNKRILRLTTEGGRYPGPLAPKHRCDNIRAILSVIGRRVIFRIDDNENIERWEEFSVLFEDLNKWLQHQMRSHD